MFGHDNNTDDDKDVQINDELLQPEEQHEENTQENQGGNNEGGAVEVSPSEPTGTPSDDNTDNKPADDAPVAPTEEETVPETVQPTVPTTDSASLLDIKQQALTSLSPLLGHLDQTPDEKFRTTMMLIQASDNQDLVKTAFEAAQAITDEKARAQALLDIVNEINYFTQKNS